MSEKAFEGKPPQEKEPFFLNNFYCFLPGGPYRSFYDSSPEKAKIIDAIDELLKSEFSNLDTQSIIDGQYEAGEILAELSDFDRPKSDEQRKVLMDRLKELEATAKESDDKLRPLFDRLVEMGFNAVELTR